MEKIRTKNPKKKNGLKITISILVGIIVLLIAVSAVLISMTTWVGEKRETVTAGTDAFKKGLYGMTSQQDIEITCDELNSSITYYLLQINKYSEQEITSESTWVEDLYVEFLGENKLEVKIFLIENGKQKYISSIAEVSYNEFEHILRLSSDKIKVGKLNLPAQWVLNSIKPENTDELAPGITVMQNGINIDLSGFPVELKTISITEEFCKITTGNAFESFLSEFLGDFLTEEQLETIANSISVMAAKVNESLSEEAKAEMDELSEKLIEAVIKNSIVGGCEDEMSEVLLDIAKRGTQTIISDRLEQWIGEFNLDKIR